MKRIVMGVILFACVAGVAYLATVGCCQLMGSSSKTVPLSDELKLDASQKRTVASLEGSFLSQKQTICQNLCAKRAQVIQLLRQPEPDRAALSTIVEEIGQEQILLEKGTLEHLLALRQYLTPAQQIRLVDLMGGELRSACKATACGMTPGCSVAEKK